MLKRGRGGWVGSGDKIKLSQAITRGMHRMPDTSVPIFIPHHKRGPKEEGVRKATQTARNKRMKVTLVPMPWDAK